MRKPKSGTAEKDQDIVSTSPVSAKERYQMIAEAAYFRAEKRGFTDGHVDEDWIAAEAEVDQRLRNKASNQPDSDITHELEQLVRAVLENDTDSVSEQVRAITLNTLSGKPLDHAILKRVMSAVIEGAKQGAATHQDPASLKEAIHGLDNALTAAAEATQLAIQEASSRSTEFSQQGLRKTLDDLTTIESLLIETLSNAAQNASGTTRAILHDLAEHARESGTSVGAQAEAALLQLAHALSDTTKEKAAVSAQTLRKESALLASLATGVLSGISAKLQSTLHKKPSPPSDRSD